MSQEIEGSTYGLRISTAEAESLITGDEWGEPPHAVTGPSEPDQQQEANPGEIDGDEIATAESDATQETEQPDGSEEASSEATEEHVAHNEVEIDGETYSMDQLKEFISDSQNKSEWQKTNTQKAQDLAKERKALRAESEKWQALKKDDELMESLKDYVDDDHPLFQKVDESSDEPEIETEAQDTVPETRYTDLEDKVAQMEADRQVERDVVNLQAKYPVLKESAEALNQVLKTALDRDLDDLEVAYAVTAFQGAEDSALKTALSKVDKAKELQKIPETQGASRAQRAITTKVPASYDEARDLAFQEYSLFE